MANFGLLGLFGRSALARPGDVQRGPATWEDRGQLWQEPEESRFQVNEPPPAPSPSPFDDPLARARFMTQFGIDPAVVQPHQVTPEMQQFVTTLLRPVGLLGRSN